MSKKVPYKTDYDLVEKNEQLSLSILFVSVAVSLFAIISEKCNIPFCKTIPAHFFVAANSFLAVCYFLSDIVSNYLFQSAETKRRKDFFDNSLNTKLAEETSEEYFTNDNISHGNLKLGVNSFENSFFTMSIAKKMFMPMFGKSVIFFLLFLAVALFVEHNWLYFILQLALPFTIFQQTFRLYIFRKRVQQVFENFQQIFSATQDQYKHQLIMHNVTTYETTLAWACIKLDSKIFNEMNPELSTKWKEIKNRLNL